MKKGPAAGCTCSFCEEELKKNCVEPEFCRPCGVDFVVCRSCGARHTRTLVRCPACGTPVKKEGE